MNQLRMWGYRELFVNYVSKEGWGVRDKLYSCNTIIVNLNFERMCFFLKMKVSMGQIGKSNL